MSGLELKPCPFCGGEARLFIGMVAFDDYEVQCAKCGFSGPNFGASDEPDARDDAINHWNTRALIPADAIAARDAMIAEAVAKEREACAQMFGPIVAAAIRKRGEGQP